MKVIQTKMIPLAGIILLAVAFTMAPMTYAKKPDGGGGGGGGGGGETSPKNAFNIMMNYELGMHCTGFEFAYCCVLPPYNSILAQVVKTEKVAGENAGKPILMEADPNILDGLGRPYVVRDLALDANGEFKKYVLRYWHDAQPRDAGEAGAPQTSTLISLVEGNSLLMWNTVFDSAVVNGSGSLVYGTSADGSTNVVLGDGDTADANDNYWNGIWNHLYIHSDLTGAGMQLNGESPESSKVRLGVQVVYPENTGAALHPMGPGVAGGAGLGNVLTYSEDTGTVVFTQMKVVEDLPIMLTAPRIWEALGLPLTPFEDTIDFFTDPGAVDETSLRPYVAMKAQMHNYDPSATDGIGTPVLDNGAPVIGMGTAPIDIPNCERCHALGDGASVNSAQNGNPAIDALVQAEISFWNTELGIGAGDSDWYPRLKGAAISMLALHDEQHGTAFTAAYDPNSADGNPSTRLGHDTVLCQRCHADNVIAVVKSADCGPDQMAGSAGITEGCENGDPRNELWSNITANTLIPPLTEAIHLNHQNNPFDDSLGRNGGCQGCHPAHRSDGDMSNYPISELGLNTFSGSDNRDAAGGCFVGRDVHSNPLRNDEATTPSHMNAMGQWLVDNVVSDSGQDKGIWCTNCHNQLGQELWKAENVASLVHATPGDPGHVREPFAGATLADVASGIGVTLSQAEAWLDPKTTADMIAIWNSDPGMCDHVSGLFGGPVSPFQDGGVATIEVNLADGANCSTGIGVPGPNCGGAGPAFYICLKTEDLDTPLDDGGVNVVVRDFCTTPDCVAAIQATLTGPGQAAVPVPFSAATDGRDHWLAGGEPHCADCHAAPYVEQSGNINAFPPFNYPRKASLFRYSRGHQDITCQGCHESIHGLYPVTPPGYVAGSTKAVDQTTWDQAAGMNTDGSHGPLKCGACHDANSAGVNKIAADLTYNGTTIGQDYDAAVSWMHTYTDEADPRDYLCTRCHVDNRSLVSLTNGKWTSHAKQGRVSRASMDKVEAAENVAITFDEFGTPSEDPLATVCTSCHGDRERTLQRKGCSSAWKNHLIQGRASEHVWEYVSSTVVGDTCGW